MQRLFKLYNNLLIVKQYFFTIPPKNQPISWEKENIFSVGRWGNDEHNRFIEAIFWYGNEWRKVEHYIKTRNSSQARSHAQKFFINIQKKFIDQHGELAGSCYFNKNDVLSVNEHLVRFALWNWNCENVWNYFYSKDISGDYYYKDENKYCFMLHWQKWQNYKCNANKTNFQEEIKIKFIKLLLTWLHNTRIHNNKLKLLRELEEGNEDAAKRIYLNLIGGSEDVNNDNNNNKKKNDLNERIVESRNDNKEERKYDLIGGNGDLFYYNYENGFDLFFDRSQTESNLMNI